MKLSDLLGKRIGDLGIYSSIDSIDDFDSNNHLLNKIGRDYEDSKDFALKSPYTSLIRNISNDYKVEAQYAGPSLFEGNILNILKRSFNTEYTSQILNLTTYEVWYIIGYHANQILNAVFFLQLEGRLVIYCNIKSNVFTYDLKEDASYTHKLFNNLVEIFNRESADLSKVIVDDFIKNFNSDDKSDLARLRELYPESFNLVTITNLQNGTLIEGTDKGALVLDHHATIFTIDMTYLQVRDRIIRDPDSILDMGIDTQSILLYEESVSSNVTIDDLAVRIDNLINYLNGNDSTELDYSTKLGILSKGGYNVDFD